MKGPLRIAILECDTPVPNADAKYKGYGGIFTLLLESAAESMREEGWSRSDLETSAWDVVTAQEYPRLEDVDAVLISGSKYNSFDNDDWILKLVEFTKSLLDQDRVRTIGVCFGHQIIGRAMGVKVGRSELGWETSVSLVKLTDKGQELFKKDILSIHQMHRDVVFEYPPSVEQLGDSPRCQVQGMYIKKKMIAVQGHPEFNEEIMREILDARKSQGIFDQEFYDEATNRVAHSQDGVLIAQAFLRFLIEE